MEPNRADTWTRSLQEEPMRVRSLEKSPAFPCGGSIVSTSMMVACCGWLASALPTRAAETPAPALKTKLVSISLFKNGLGFVAREAEVPKGQASSLIENMPAPALGTFWVYSPGNEAAVKELVAFESEAVEQVDAISVAEMLEANVGQTVDLRLGEKETIRARILSVAPNRPVDPSADPTRSFTLPPTEASSLVLLQEGGGTRAVNKNMVQQISSSNGPLRTSI